MLRGLVVCLVVTSTTVLCAQEWWRTAIFYQIYPRSFKDSDNDGVGDIKGITSKVEYLKDLGVNAVWLSPIYKSPMADFGYDISDFTDIDPIFGNIEDLKELISALKDVGIKIIMDFVPNHSSDEHPWFSKSVKQEDNFGDYYVWRDKKGDNEDGTPIEPNNWQSVFSGSAWKWNDERQQFYLHQFVAKQPDLNYRNPDVVRAMKKSMEFWLDLGVDGFRVDAVKFLVEDDTFPDEPLIDQNKPLSYFNMEHIHTTNHQLTFSIIDSWNDLVKEKNKDGNARILLLEVYNPIREIIPYYGDSEMPFSMPFNFQLLEAINPGMSAKDLEFKIKEWLETMPFYGTANWVVGNHDNSRVATRAGTELVDAINMILAMLPGIMITYNGEELGMTDTYLKYEETVDPSGLLLGPDNYKTGSRDPERTPMQWDDSENAGFSNYSTWLPVNPNYWRLNAGRQNVESPSRSHLQVYRDLSKLRQTPTFLSKSTSYEIEADENNTLFIKRSSPEGKMYILIVNFSSNEVVPAWPVDGVDVLSPHICSINAVCKEGESFDRTSKLRPKSAIILTTDK